MTGGALVSVVVVNYNGLAHLEECLGSLASQTYSPLEVIVVDNGSSDGSVESVRRRYPQVRWLLLGRNTGFAAGNNRGFQIAAGSYVALLNNDAVAAHDWIETLVAAAERLSEFGMFASRILLRGAPGLVDKAGHLMYWDGQNKGRGSGEPDGAEFDQPAEIFFPDGCAALYRRALLDDIGGFDEMFFAYGDDADLGIRARLRGWKAFYVPQSKVWHHHSGTAGVYSPQKIFWVERNRLWLAMKSFPLWLLLVSPIFTANRFFWNFAFAVAGRGAAGNFRKGYSLPLLARTIVSAYVDGLRQIGPIWRARRSIRQGRRLSDLEFFGLMRRFRISARDLAARD
jgi:GT2 family glycosyltransferase